MNFNGSFWGVFAFIVIVLFIVWLMIRAGILNVP